jgi:tetratricopeptide (TPR) repeat protein
LIAALCLLATACQRSAPIIDRAAILTIENLSGDPSLDWMAQAIPAIATAQLAGSKTVTAVRADTTRDIPLGFHQNGVGAIFVHGYFDQKHFNVQIEDQNHAMRTLPVAGNVLAMAQTIAHAIDPAAEPFSSNNVQAVEAWAKRDYARAVELDPDFGAAWRDWLLTLDTGASRADFEAVAQRAALRPNLRGRIEQAQVALHVARNVTQWKSGADGNAEAISKAALALAAETPRDTTTITTLAEQENNGRRFATSIALYQAVLRQAPNAAGVRNSLGYAQFFNGDLAAARKSFDAYAKEPGAKANAADSQGEVLFMAGEFELAEPYFLQAHQSSPELLSGKDLLKAAYARWLAGDLPEADKLHAQYLKYRTSRGDSAIDWRAALWEYATGRAAQAIARLRATPPNALTAAQLQIWRGTPSFLSDLKQLEANMRAQPTAADGWERVLYARALFKAGQLDAARTLAQRWPLPEVGDERFASLLYPYYRDLRAQLFPAQP